MVLNGGKALLADDMLDPAGIVKSCFFLDSQYHQPGRDQLMTFIYLIGNLMSVLCQTDTNRLPLLHKELHALARTLEQEGTSQDGDRKPPAPLRVIWAGQEPEDGPP